MSFALQPVTPVRPSEPKVSTAIAVRHSVDTQAMQGPLLSEIAQYDKDLGAKLAASLDFGRVPQYLCRVDFQNAGSVLSTEELHRFRVVSTGLANATHFEKVARFKGYVAAGVGAVVTLAGVAAAHVSASASLSVAPILLGGLVISGLIGIVVQNFAKFDAMFARNAIPKQLAAPVDTAGTTVGAIAWTK